MTPMDSQENKRPLSELEKREELIAILQGEHVQLLIEKSAKTAIEHVLIRFGFRTEGVADLQADMNFIREFRTRMWPSVEKEMETLTTKLLEYRAEHLMHEKICGERYDKIVDNQKKSTEDAQEKWDTAARDRADIKRDIRMFNIALLAGMVTIIGFFIKAIFFP